MTINNPWLIFGQGVQVGKSAAKGNGVYELTIPSLTPYWSHLRHPTTIAI